MISQSSFLPNSPSPKFNLHWTKGNYSVHGDTLHFDARESVHLGAFQPCFALRNQSLALGVPGSAIHDCDIPWLLLHQVVNNFIGEFTPIVWMQYPWGTQEGKYLIL